MIHPGNATARLWRGLLLAGVVTAAALGALWAFGAAPIVEGWAASSQRDAQNALAAAIRRLRAGEAGALIALLSVAFAYGFFHAVGPGHGKMLIGAYGVARRIRLLPLALIALGSSLAQATTAVALVYSGVLVFDWTRSQVSDVADNWMLPVSHGAIVLVGLWLVVRGVRAMGTVVAQKAGMAHAHGGALHVRHDKDHGLAHDHAHTHSYAHPDGHHHEQGPCATCGHRHGPSIAEIEQVRSMRDAVLLMGGIGLRPCTGALFLLLITWQLGVASAGVLGTYAMALGTATVTVAVAGIAVWTREGAFASAPGLLRLRAVLPVIEIVAGALIALVAATLLIRTI